MHLGKLLLITFYFIAVHLSLGVLVSLVRNNGGLGLSSNASALTTLTGASHSFNFFLKLLHFVLSLSFLFCRQGLLLLSL